MSFGSFLPQTEGKNKKAKACKDKYECNKINTSSALGTIIRAPLIRGTKLPKVQQDQERSTTTAKHHQRCRSQKKLTKRGKRNTHLWNSERRTYRWIDWT